MIMMKRLCAGLAGVLSLLALWAAPAAAWNRGHAEIFAVLPAGSPGPESINGGPDGDGYFTTFWFNNKGAPTREVQLFFFTPAGDLLRPANRQHSSPSHSGVTFT